jgi:hypothetical protein
MQLSLNRPRSGNQFPHWYLPAIMNEERVHFLYDQLSNSLKGTATFGNLGESIVKSLLDIMRIKFDVIQILK